MLTKNHQLLNLSQRLIDICRCLEPFGIHHFTYLKQYTNGSRVSLSNKPQWIADYYNLNLYKSSLFENHIQEVRSSFNVWFGDYDLDVYKHGRDYYNTMHAISIVKQGNLFCESFLFSTTPDNPEAIHYLSNNREILEHFILYLKDRGKHILQSADKHKIKFNQLTENSLKWHADKRWLDEMDKRKQEFFSKSYLSQIRLVTPHSQVKISPREIECISHLLNHKSSREIAEIMRISPRTVETYLGNIKNKLNCETKNDLINMIKQLSYWPVFS